MNKEILVWLVTALGFEWSHLWYSISKLVTAQERPAPIGLRVHHCAYIWLKLSYSRYIEPKLHHCAYIGQKRYLCAYIRPKLRQGTDIRSPFYAAHKAELNCVNAHISSLNYVTSHVLDQYWTKVTSVRIYWT